MVKDYQRFEVGNMAVEVNYNEEVKPCKLIKFTFTDPKTKKQVVETIDHGELYSLLMLFGNDKEQEALIPTTKTELRVIERLLHVRAKKDMKEGDVITFPYRYAIPEQTYQRLLKENPKEYRPVSLSPALKEQEKSKGGKV